MKSVYETRRENLRSLITHWGGPTSLAKKLGHSNGSYIAQLVGPHPSREISEKVGRQIEGKLGLPTGWLDQEQPNRTAKLNDKALADCVRAVAAVLRDAGLRPDPDVYATLVQLVYDRKKLTGEMDEDFLKQLVELLAK